MKRYRIKLYDHREDEFYNEYIDYARNLEDLLDIIKYQNNFKILKEGNSGDDYLLYWVWDPNYNDVDVGIFIKELN